MFEFVRPETYGAIADGVTDCAPAFRLALEASPNILLTGNTYYIGSTIELNSQYPKNIVIKSESESTILLENNITGFNFNGYGIESEPRDYDTIHFEGINFVEKNNMKTSTAISFCGRENRLEQELAVELCAFVGLDRAIFISYCGYIMFNGNNSQWCNKVCEIGRNTMFTYFYDNESSGDNYFIYCAIPFNGGASNGIYCNHNIITGAVVKPIYVNYNQSIYIDNCEIKETNADSLIDITGCYDGSITNCKIEGAAGSIGINLWKTENINVANNYLTGSSIGIQLLDTSRGRDNEVILGNTIDCNIPISIKDKNDVKICDNYFNGEIEEEKTVNIIKDNNNPLTEEKKNSEIAKEVEDKGRYRIYDVVDDINTFPHIEVGAYNLKEVIEGLSGDFTVLDLTSDRTIVDETIDISGKSFMIKGKSSRQSVIETWAGASFFHGTNAGEIYFVDVALCGQAINPHITAVEIENDGVGSLNAYRVIAYNMDNLFKASGLRQGTFLFVRNFSVKSAFEISNSDEIYIDTALNAYQCGKLIDFDDVEDSMVLNSCSCGATQTEITINNCNNILLKTCSADAGYDSEAAAKITDSANITLYDSWLSSSNFSSIWSHLPSAPDRVGLKIYDCGTILIQCCQFINNKYGIEASCSTFVRIEENKGEANITYDFLLDELEDSILSHNSDVSYLQRGCIPEFCVMNGNRITCEHNTITHEDVERLMMIDCENSTFDNIFNVSPQNLIDLEQN